MKAPRNIAPSQVLVTGGEGQLARELRKIDSSILAPPQQELDVSSYESIEGYCKGRALSVIIHAAAVTNKFNEDVDEGYISTNIAGTANVVLWCRRHGVRLVYLSTDYVYPGQTGGYSEDAVLYPVNRYAVSKLGGECAVGLYSESLIIRTSFYRELPFSEGCTDQYTSRMPIREAAEAVYQLALRPEVKGIINVGRSQRRSLFEIVQKEFNPAVRPVRRQDLPVPYHIPPDSSLNTNRFESFMRTRDTSSKTLSACRICGSKELISYLDLGATPLANSYLTPEGLNEPEFKEDLSLVICPSCGLSQLTKVVHPDLMFRSYLYVSSTTDTFQRHCEELARTTTGRIHARDGGLVLDIASNDGCLLSKFRDIGMNVVGVDPAENLAKEANASGIETLNAYWSQAVAKDLAARFGNPVIITATNVFAHVDDLHEFVRGVETCLARKGIFVIECPYVMDFIEKNEFDTAYHEHLSYIGITPLVRLMQMHDMEVFDVEYFADLHGGTIRTYVCRRGEMERSPHVSEFLERESRFGVTKEAPYRSFGERVLLNKTQLRALIARERAAGKTIWAYGASAKGNTLVNFFGIGSADVPVAIDDN
ncbi:MAG TPA: sugar nucleotide-binding protein, partial [Bacteroidota bacterium]|nr:sugar nucleotide-binding protein [Bacteroidota bacterium]